MNIGDTIWHRQFLYRGPGVIVRIDIQDASIPYWVKFANGERHWVNVKNVAQAPAKFEQLFDD